MQTHVCTYILAPVKPINEKRKAHAQRGIVLKHKQDSLPVGREGEGEGEGENEGEKG